MLELDVEYVERATQFLGITQKELNILNGVPEEQPVEQTNPYMSDNPFLQQIQKVEPPPEKPTMVNYILFLKIMQDPSYLEYESFKIIDYAHIKLYGQNYFIQVNDDLYKQCRLDGNTKANNAKSDLSSTLRGGGSAGKCKVLILFDSQYQNTYDNKLVGSSGYGRNDLTSTMRKY